MPPISALVPLACLIPHRRNGCRQSPQLVIALVPLETFPLKYEFSLPEVPGDRKLPQSKIKRTTEKGSFLFERRQYRSNIVIIMIPYQIKQKRYPKPDVKEVGLSTLCDRSLVLFNDEINPHCNGITVHNRSELNRIITPLYTHYYSIVTDEIFKGTGHLW